MGKAPLACARGFVALIAVWAAALCALSLLACAPSALAPLVAASPLGAFVQTPLSPIAFAALVAAMGGIGALLGTGAALFLRRRAIRRLRASAARRLDIEAQKHGEKRRQRALRIRSERADESESTDQSPRSNAPEDDEASAKDTLESAAAAPIDDADERPEGEQEAAIAEPQSPNEPSRAILALRSRQCDQLSLLQLTERCAVALSRFDRASPLSEPARQRFANRLRQLASHPGLGAPRSADGAERNRHPEHNVPLARRVHSSEMRLQSALRALERLSARG